MNKTAIRNYAVWARTRLIEQVGQQAFNLGFSREGSQAPEFVGADAIILNGSVYDAKFKEQREKLRAAITRKGYDEVLEEAAYTWFNRFAAIRFMEVNGFLPHGIRMLSSAVAGKSEPDILGKAVSTLLPVDKPFIFRCIEESRSEDLFRHLVLAQCHELHQAMPFLFEPITDYTELLFPANLLQEGSVVRRMVTDIPDEDWQDVEIVGWLYQYYISEKQQEVVGINKGVINKRDVAAATQLFTPHWIVQYMLENSLGRIWLTSHPQSPLREKWRFLLEPTKKVSASVEAAIISPETLTVFDPACGSGHILTYAFDMLFDIYLESGYVATEIPQLILKKNLFGLDIDDRAAQLAAFAVLMKARFKNPDVFDLSDISINVMAIKETAADTNSLKAWLIKNEPQAETEIASLWNTFRDGKNIGSLVNIDFDPEVCQAALESVKEKAASLTTDLFEHVTLEELLNLLPELIKQSRILSDRYPVVVTNPPYMGRKGLNAGLREFVDQNFSNYSSDLFSVFIRRNFDFTHKGGYLGFMSPFVWMFIKSYEDLRKYIIEEKTIATLVQLEYGAFEDAVVPICTFVLQNKQTDSPGVYVKLSDFKGAANQPIKVLEAARNPSVDFRYETKTEDFSAIPGSPIAYWASKNHINAFELGVPLGKLALVRNGMKTGDNDRFLRLWWEISAKTLNLNSRSAEDAKTSKAKWFPYNKGGEYRKWFGNEDYVVNWEKSGAEIFNNAKTDGRNVQDYPSELKFRPSVSWSLITSGKPAFRFKSRNLSDIAGMSFYSEQESILYLLGFCNTPIASEILKLLAPTINFQAGDIARLPVIIDEKVKAYIDHIVNNNIELAVTDWNSFETSWGFSQHPLSISKSNTIKSAMQIWEDASTERVRALKANEMKLNRVFADLYAFGDEIDCEPDDSDITIRRADLNRDIRSFLSYAIGCMLGRYSPDTPGLVYAGGDFDPGKYSTFAADDDAIISVLDDNWFADDVTGRFVDFLRTTFGEETLAANVDFIADALGRTANETSMERIRKYFVNDFYKDHLKTYQKRPIYWLFTSGKEKAFQALVYMHRYDKNTLPLMRSEYLHTLQGKLEFEFQRLSEAEKSAASTREKQTAAKRLAELVKKQEELRKYDELLRHMADQQIEIDLDDGVKVNYAKFNGLVAPI